MICLVSAGHDGDINFWSLEDGVLLHTYEGRREIITDDSARSSIFTLFPLFYTGSKLTTKKMVNV